MRFTRALVRRPTPNFADGLTEGLHGVPDFAVAKAQHERYCEQLTRSGLQLTYVAADARYPDATFIEDTAILTRRGAIITRPGAVSRMGEVDAVREALVGIAPSIGAIEPPGTVDGGDICETNERFLIGISARTNEDGARQLAAILTKHGFESMTIDIRGDRELLHLKSGLAALDDGRLVVGPALAGRTELRSYPLVRVADRESYAANCISVNGRVLIPRGFPVLEDALGKLRYDVVTLEMSEFRKMDGGLSCLSLRS